MSETRVNWCEELGTVLANELIVDTNNRITESVLLKYIKVTKEQHALRMLKTNHFKKLNSIKTLRAI